MPRRPSMPWLAATAILVLNSWLAASTTPPARDRDPDPGLRVVFREQVQPILEKRCRPCHFPGGDQYGKLPFDAPRTVVRVGKPVLQRLKEPEEAATLRAFLERSGALEP